MVRNIPPRRNPAHLTALFDVLEQARPKGETRLTAACTSWPKPSGSGRW